MNYKKIITSILLVSDGPVEHAYFCDNFDISEKELLELLAEINDSLSQEIKSRTKHEYYKFYKPKGYICSHEKQGDSPVIFDLIGKEYLKFGGRLDK